MTGLVRREGALVRRGPRDVEDRRGLSASTEHVAFDGVRVVWADLPARTRRAASRPAPLVYEDVERHGSVLDAGRPYELATGWRVYEDAVVLAAVRRPLRPGPPGYPAIAAGPWEPGNVRVGAFSGGLRRRRGVVPVAAELGDERGMGPASAAKAADSSADHAWRYLPTPVRVAAERLVPEPEHWFGQILQSTSTSGFPVAQTVGVLRMSATRVVLVVAERSLRAPVVGDVELHRSRMAQVPWLVDQVGAELGAPLRSLGTPA